MQKLPLVSIVTPSYNQREFIEDVILCVKNQSYPNIEHIIVDGASTDNTLSIIKKYEGTYNLHWTSEPDENPIQAINKGFSRATGEIIARLCTDDLYFPWTVSVAVNYFNNHPDVELIYGDMIDIHLRTGIKRLSFYPQLKPPLLSYPSPSTFFSRSVIEKLGLFREDLVVAGEYEYWVRVNQKCKVVKIDEFLGIDRVQAKSMRVRNRPQMLEESKIVIQTHSLLKGTRWHLFKLAFWLKAYLTKKYLQIKFVFHYQKRGDLSHPWQNLIRFHGFRVLSWYRFFITLLPFGHYGYKGNWFTLTMPWCSCKGEENEK